MKLILLFAVLAALAFVAVTLKTRGSATPGRKATGDVRKRNPLTEREQAMYFRLTKTFPDTVVLAQVAMSALLDTNDRPTRSTFDRKVCDFVLCSKAFHVLAIVELDDSTHRNKEARDERRDAILGKAGYRTLRFKQVPDAADLRAAVDGATFTALS